ncbi:hypothetical protein BDN71DRAFT_1435913 [Pleurotus eryngii]|uniref:Uncharacterized protein n=1 Tax=Pleurotus eryngii TaxID=5323 RepID=A0A9P5ZJ68_PLEER|nr:hypothetical protein BDN71DRAFT_1435913 [Pleurotus eryngii]
METDSVGQTAMKTETGMQQPSPFHGQGTNGSTAHLAESLDKSTGIADQNNGPHSWSLEATEKPSISDGSDDKGEEVAPQAGASPWGILDFFSPATLNNRKMIGKRNPYFKWQARLTKDDPLVVFNNVNHLEVFHSPCGRKVVMDKLYDIQAWDRHWNNCLLPHTRMESTHYMRWKDKVLAIDKGAQFHPSNVCCVRHSTCGNDLLMKEPYNISWFATHKCGIPTVSTSMIISPVNTAHTPVIKFPVNKKPKRRAKAAAGTLLIAQFLQRPTSPSKVISIKLATVRKGCPGLTSAHDEHIKIYLRHSATPSGGGTAVSEVTVSSMDVAAIPCTKCLSLHRHSRFQKALSVPLPNEKDFIHLNQQYRGQVIGEIYAWSIGLKDLVEMSDAKNTPCIKYAQGVLLGQFKNFGVFTGLVEAMVTKANKLGRGVGMQNFQYAPAWDEFCRLILIHSPRAYRAMDEHLAIRSSRNFRLKESRQPCFSAVINERTFQLAKQWLNSLNYSGPLGLSCDDTKLHASLRLYWDSTEQAYFLIGGTDGPILVADPEQVNEALKDFMAEKGTKAHLWSLMVPLPGVTPIVLAVKAISGDLSSGQLLQFLKIILDGLIRYKMEVISYAADGTEVERSVQQKFMNECVECGDHLTMTIPHPDEGANIVIVIPRYKSQLIVMIQDSKHALKMLHNNAFTGAKLMVIGNHTFSYRDFHMLAFQDGSPMYHRDVEKLDQQDDNAAARMFAAETLIYLFIFGELIDVYQHRSMPHNEHLLLVLCARYFLDAWEKYLTVTKHKLAHHFLSREAIDILRYIINGFIGLIIIHHDHLDNTFPFLPWLHSTEACKHIFSEVQCIVKDFTMLDFLHMVPKLQVRIRQAVLKSKMLDPSTPARGYCHTYFANTTTDLSSLSLFPSSSDIANIALQAMQEADSLINICGIHPMHLHYKATPVLLQSIGSWYEDDDLDAEDLEDQSLCEARILKELIVQGEDENVSRNQELDLAKEQRYAQAHHHPKLPDVRVLSELSKPLSHGSLQQKSISFSELINLHRSHQTEHAVRCSPSYQMVRRIFNNVNYPKTGNGANAAIVADNLRDKALQRRAGLFLNAKVPRINDLTST